MKVFMNPMTYMMQIITRQRWSGLWLGGLLVISAGLVSGCSGGGSSSSSTPPVSTTPPASTVGTFVDSPVDGLHYTSPPSNPAGGVTRGGGHFQCQADDHVTFDLVGRVIGIPQPCSSNPVTAVSVFGATSATDPKVVNLSRLLLTLGCPLVDNCNVIQLPATLPALPGTLDFSLPTTTFATNIQAAGGLTLVPEATATTHLQASFKMLSVAVVNSGTVTSVPAGINCSAGTCSVPFLTGTEVTLTATGTGFTGWSGGGCSGTGTCVVSLNADAAVTATFPTAPPPATLTITTAGTGTGTGTVTCSVNGGAFSACAPSYPYGTALVLQAVANTGSTFTGWSTGSVSCTGTGNCAVLLTADSAVMATFTLNVTQFQVTANRASANGGGGSVVCSANGGAAGPCDRYPVGTPMTVTATPDGSSNFTGWSGTVCQTAGTGLCNFTLNADTVVTANFNRPTLSVVLVGTGIGTVTSTNIAGINCGATCTTAFNKGTSITLSVVGAGLAGWSGGGCAGTGTCVVTLNQDITVTATLTTVAGVAAAYFIRGGTVNAYEVDNGGTVSTTSIGTAATGAEGSFSVTLSKTPTGAIQLVVTGGSYTSEADQTKTVTNGSLSVLLPTVPASGLSNVSIHPLTSMATSQALTALKTGASSDVARAVATANTAIKSLYGLTADPNTIRPDYTKAAVTTNPDAARLALILGAIEQLVINLNVTPSALYGALVSDFADGKLDGKNATGAVPLESGTLAPPTGTANFLIALTAYEAHPSGTQLSSNGIAAADLSSIDAGLRQTMVAAVPTGAVVLTVTTAGTGTGTVTSAPAGITCGMACMAAFSSGTTVTLSANANAVSTFVGWSRGGCAVGNGAVTPTATTTIQATFAASVGGGTVPLTVTTAGTGTGTVTSAPAGITCGTICAENFPLGTTVTLTANPDASSTFVGWSGSGCAGIGLCTVTPTAATTVQATFTTTTPGAGPAGASVTLAWGSVNDPSVQGYRVYYGTASLNYQPPFDAGLNTTFTISNLQSGTGYYFAVTAYNSAGQSGYSDEVSVTCPL